MGSGNDHLSNEAAVNYINTSTQEFFEYMGGYSQYDFLDHIHYKGLISDVPHQIVNCIMEARLKSETVQSDIGNLMTPFREKHLPLTWYVWPTSTPADLSDHLLSYGFEHSHDSPGMLADLSDLPKDVSIPDGTRIERVSNDALLKDWMEPFNAGYQMPEMVNDFFFSFYKEFGYAEDLPMQNYLVYYEDEPVSCVTLYMGENHVAGIWGVATSPQARGKGLGTVITWKGCVEAIQKGCQYAILISSQMGYNVYRRLGFREYCKVGYYLWQPQDND
jgi:ribosomal protein S18 acetylase RimI-like enzyme